MWAAFFILFSVILGRAEAALEQQAYIWQRNWVPRVATSIEEHAEHLDGLTVLCAEGRLGARGVPAWVRVSPDWEALKSSGLPITLAIRVGRYSGSFDGDAPMTQSLLGEVAHALRLARAGGLEPVAVEIDFDCASLRLEAYVHWLKLLRSPLDGVPLSITTLPTWMGRPEAFAPLVEASDHFVLQVHSIQRANQIDSDVVLCDSTRAKRWAEQAARYGVPFHIALPTYAYRLGYDAEGTLVEVAAEDASPLQNPDWRYRVIRAEPEAMASLVEAFKHAPLDHCLGLIWYRLPIGKELHNWDADTWRAVMAGRLADEGWSLESRLTAEGVVEIEVMQNSEIALEPPSQIVVSWSEGTALAWDGQRNYSVLQRADHSLTWTWPDNMTPPLLSKGTRWTIGWLRMEAPTDLNLTIIPHVD
jgi:hypothetical protein